MESPFTKTQKQPANQQAKAHLISVKANALILTVILAFSVFGCKTEVEKETSIQTGEETTVTTKGTYAVRSVSAAASSASVVLSWVNPADISNFGGVEITWNGATKFVPVVRTSCEISGLEAETYYIFKITTLDSSLYKTDSAVTIVIRTPATQTVSKEQEKDTTAPASVANFYALVGSDKAVLTWQDPKDADLFGIKIYKPVPTDSRNIVSLDDGILINKEAESYEITGLNPSQEYTFKIAAVDTSLNESPVSSITITTKAAESTEDTTPPALVTNLEAACENGRMNLNWTNPTDEDFWGVEITANPATGVFKNAVYVKGSNSFSCSNLSSGTDYTFSIKSLDNALNESEATISGSVTYNDGKDSVPMEITLSLTTENIINGKTKNDVTIIATIKSASTIKKVVYKQAGSIDAATLLADKDAQKATADESDNSRWTFVLPVSEDLNEKTFTVAAIDTAGREETEQIKLNDFVVFDTTAPDYAINLKSEYNDNSEITLTWTDPKDEDFDHVLISYITNDGQNSSEKKRLATVEKNTQTYTLSNVDTSAEYYKLYIESFDDLGNKSTAVSSRAYLQKNRPKCPEGFVEFYETTVSSSIGRQSHPFYNASTEPVTVNGFYMAETELTYLDWYEVFTWATSDDRGDEIYSFANKGCQDSGYTAGASPKNNDFPVGQISWRDAIVWCNAASEKDNLIPVYQTSESDATPVRKAEDRTTSEGNGSAEKAYVNPNANGYRLPTAVEWEFAARGGDPTTEAWSYTYCGTNDISLVHKYSLMDSRGFSSVKRGLPNTAGLYNMTGNLSEWCYDKTENGNNDNYRLLYGNDFSHASDFYLTRSSNWNFYIDYHTISRPFENGGSYYYSFRIARNAE